MKGKVGNFAMDYKLLCSLLIGLAMVSFMALACLRAIWRFCAWDDALAKIEDLDGMDHVDEWARPVVVYEYKGGIYKLRHRYTQFRGGYEVGESVNICVNPKNPANYVLTDWAGPVFGLFFSAVLGYVSIKDLIKLPLWP
ncbi:hypothetical protein JCM2811A_14510 [Methylorubrum rhodinum]